MTIDDLVEDVNQGQFSFMELYNLKVKYEGIQFFDEPTMAYHCVTMLEGNPSTLMYEPNKMTIVENIESYYIDLVTYGKLPKEEGFLKPKDWNDNGNLGNAYKR